MIIIVKKKTGLAHCLHQLLRYDLFNNNDICLHTAEIPYELMLTFQSRKKSDVRQKKECKVYIKKP